MPHVLNGVCTIYTPKFHAWRPLGTCAVEPRNADTSGTNFSCPDYRGVLYSGVGTFYHYNEYIK